MRYASLYLLSPGIVGDLSLRDSDLVQTRVDPVSCFVAVEEGPVALRVLVTFLF